MKQWIFIAVCGFIFIGGIMWAIKTQEKYVELTVNVKIRQNNSEIISLETGKIKINVGEINDEKLSMAIFCPDTREELLSSTVLHENQKIYFELGDVKYELYIRKLKDHKILKDSAHFVITKQE